MNTPEQPVTPKALTRIARAMPDSLCGDVARMVADCCDDDLTRFFRDLAQHGCISGMVGDLIYYTDTHAFYDRHYDEIERLREEIEDALGEPLKIQGDLKNALAWFAFEQTAMNIASELEIEI